MKNKRVLALLLALVIIAVTFTACAQPSPEPAPPAEEPAAEPGDDETSDDPELSLNQLSIAGAGTAGTFYVMAVAFADLFGQRLGVNAVGEVTGGSVENARLLESQQVEMAMMQLGVTQNARQGVRQFEDDGEMDIVIVSPAYPEGVQIVALENSDINSVQDLRGKRIAVGSPGSGILAFAEQFLEFYGMSMDDINPQYLSFAEATTAFRDGAIDAAIANTAAPAPFVVDLETTHPVKLISLTDEEIDDFITENPQFYRGSIPASAYRSLDEDVNTFVGWVVLNTYPEMSDDDIYILTKTIFENQESLLDVHAVAQYLIPSSVEAITEAGVPFHPGAARYYEEIGVTVPTQ